MNCSKEFQIKGNNLKILGAFLVLFCGLAEAQVVAVNCASGSLGVTYSNSAPSLQPLFTSIPSNPEGHLMLANPTTVAICATITRGTVAPAPFTDAEHCVPPGAIMAWDDLNMPTRGPVRVYLRANVAACTTGIFYADFW